MRPKVRTSLDRADSTATADEIDARRDAYASQAWQATGVLAVSVRDPRLSWDLREMVRVIAKKLGYGVYDKDAEIG